MSRRLLPARLFPLAVLTGLALVAAACGGDGEETAPTTAPAAAASPGALQPQPQPVQALDQSAAEPRDGVLEIVGEGVMFVPNNLQVPAGGAVTIRLSNRDPQPHNLRIAGPDGQYDTEDDAVTEPSTVGQGQTGELTFAPQLAGSYTFRCDFHPGSMGGRILVQP